MKIHPHHRVRTGRRPAVRWAFTTSMLAGVLIAGPLLAVLATDPTVVRADTPQPTSPVDEPPSGGAAPAGATRYVPAGPVRLLDTRAAGARPHAGATLELRLAEHLALPEGTRAAALTVTATDPSAPGFVTAWGNGPRPVASMLNLDTTGETRSNAAIVPVDHDGIVRLYTQSGAHLVADLTGVFVASGATTAGRLVPLGPVRLLDTRLDAQPLVARETRTVDATAVGVPRDAAAVAIELTAIAADGWFAAWPADNAWPGTSIVHTGARGAPTTAPAIVPVRDGRLQITGSVTGHVVIDVTGWFTGATAPVSTDGLFVPIAPTRVADTRGAHAASPPVEAGGTLELQHFPFDTTTAAAVALNLTTVQPTRDGFVTAWPATAPRPTASVANVERADVLAAGAIVPASPVGVTVFTQPSAHLVADVTGWFTTGARSLVPLPVPSPTANSSYAFTLVWPDGRWARWDPCRTIPLVVDYTGAQPGARAAVQSAAAELELALGIDLTLVEQHADATPIPGTITVRWASSADEPRFRSDVIGLGGFGATTERIVWGTVLVRSDVPLGIQPGGADLLRFVVAHELAHAVGLGHVDDPSQLMFPAANGHDTFQDGDRSGLALVGAASGCVAPKRMETTPGSAAAVLPGATPPVTVIVDALSAG